MQCKIRSISIKRDLEAATKHIEVVRAKSQSTNHTSPPMRHRSRTTTQMRGYEIVVVRFMFWKQEIQARTSVLFPETRRSQRVSPVRV